MDFKNTFFMGISINLVVFGIGLIWFLASKMDLSTLPNKPIQANDLYRSDETQEKLII